MATLNYSPPMAHYLKIFFQNGDILVLNKPNGLLSVLGSLLSVLG